MVEPYAQNQNIYACLWSLMRISCQFMKPKPEGWEPQWPINRTPEKYIVELQAYCSVINLRQPKDYSKYQQSNEMLHQAALSDNQAIATELDNNLSM